MLVWFQNNGPAILVLIGAVLSAGGAYWSAQKQAASREAAKADSEQLSAKTEEARLLQQEMAELQRQLHGFDSYCYVEGSIMRSGRVVFQLSHQGQYPLHDVRVQAYYLNAIRPTSATTMSIQGTQEDVALATVGKEMFIGEIQPGEVPFLESMPFSNDDVHHYVFTFRAKNGQWSQQLYLRQADANGDWRKATLVARGTQTVRSEGLDQFKIASDGGLAEPFTGQ